jgi:bifunctional non-homologous end joining protein LigD
MRCKALQPAPYCRRWVYRGRMAKSADAVVLQVDGHEVTVSHPGKVLFPEAGLTKLDLVQYYVAVAEGALRGAGGRPCVLVRFPDGVGGEFFFQKRAPTSRPEWVDVSTIRFPSGRSAEEVVPRNAATLAWMANLNCIELHPHPVRADDLDHPDELRVDLDPVPGVAWPQIRDVAAVAREVLQEHGLVGWPKTSGSRGIHVVVRIERRWTFDQVRRAALALAREVERRAPKLATAAWWKEERHGVFVDYNQNAKDRTVASAYSVRPRPDARVSTPVGWDELPLCDPADFTLKTVPARLQSIGDPHAGIDDAAGSLESLLELSARQEGEGQGDAPWPPHYRKQAGEPPRAPPSALRPGSGPARKAGAATKAPARKTKPLLEVVSRVEREAEAIAAAEAWKEKHPKAAAHLEPADVLVDRMRGSSSLWYRVRINLEHVPLRLRPKSGEGPKAEREKK